MYAMVLHLRYLERTMIATMAAPKKNQKTDKGKAEDKHAPRSMVGISPQLHQQLKILADRNGRPVSWELRLLIQRHLEANGLWPPEAEQTGTN
jgi:hypothetical protein